jgi:hypothetical protein
MPRVKKFTKKWADRLVSAAAILRDGRCTTCGVVNETLQPGHYFHRNRQSVKWNMDNVACQCASCNVIHNNNPEPLRRVLQRMKVDLEQLERKSNIPYRQPDMEAIVHDMQQYVGTLYRFARLSPELRERLIQGNFTNRELIQALQ